MPFTVLDPQNRPDILRVAENNVWIVACLCAAWCDVCREYRPRFEALAASHPDKQFLWVDVEDMADVVGDLDIDNFPTLLIQRADVVSFFGIVLPDPGQANRLINASASRSDAELQNDAAAGEHAAWQIEANLRQKLKESLES